VAERLLVCGSRSWCDVDPIDQQIRLSHAELEVVIEGEAAGADRIAREVAQKYAVPVLPFPAEWGVHAEGWCRCRRPGRTCPAAGPRRNRRMLDEGHPTLVVAFTDDFENPRSGTRQMCRTAVEAGIPTTLVEHAFGLWFARDLEPVDFDG
jgi:hypothetical protein